MKATVIEKAASLPDISIRIMLRTLAEEGLDTQFALRAAGLPLGLPSSPGTVSARQEFAFQKAFVQLTGYRPDIWVRAGGAYHLPSFGQFGLVLMTCSTLDDYLLTSAKTRDLDYSMADVRTHEKNGRDITGYILDVSEVPKAVRDFTLYRDLAAIVTTLRDLWGSRFPLHPIHIALPSPPSEDFTVLGEQVIFGTQQSSVTWDKRYNKCPLHYGDATLHAAYLESYRRSDVARDAKDAFIDILQAFIDQGTGAQLSLAMLAAKLGMTERTLQRRLKTYNLGFRDLVDETRRRTASELLRTSDVPIAELAFRLGYSDTISFSQAFRRWTGVTPAAMRRRNLHATS